MTDELVITSPSKKFEEIKKIDENGIEYWEARELMEVLGYTKWENFNEVIEKAKDSCVNSNQEIKYHFADVRKMVKIATGRPKETNKKQQVPVNNNTLNAD